MAAPMSRRRSAGSRCWSMVAVGISHRHRCPIDAGARWNHARHLLPSCTDPFVYERMTTMSSLVTHCFCAGGDDQVKRFILEQPEVTKFRWKDFDYLPENPEKGTKSKPVKPNKKGKTATKDKVDKKDKKDDGKAKASGDKQKAKKTKQPKQKPTEAPTAATTEL